MTFSEPVHPEQAAKRWERWVCDLEQREVRSVGAPEYQETMTFAEPVHQAQAARRCRGVRWARALEYQKRHVIHYHALLWFGGEGEPHRFTAMGRWEKIGEGWARIFTYDPQLGASHYLGKYISKGGEIDLGGKWWRSPDRWGIAQENARGTSKKPSKKVPREIPREIPGKNPVRPSR
jgi:hypothetical protein